MPLCTFLNNLTHINNALYASDGISADLLVLSPWTLTLLRSNGGATVIMKGLLGMGSPPWHTEMLMLPYKTLTGEKNVLFILL